MVSQVSCVTHGIPSHDTFRRVLSILDPEEFGKCLNRWSVALHEATDGGVIALDGKTIRHSFDSFSGQRAVHLVSAWASESGLALGQVRVDDKSNENTALAALLEMIDVKGSVVTMDGKASCETRYFISSLTGTAERFAKAVREHWAIENSLHYVLDVTMNEDKSRIRKDNAPENFAILRKIAISAINREKTHKLSVKRKMRKAAWHHAYLEKILLS